MIHAMSSLRLRDVLLILFNLFPLVLVIDGMWRPFDVLAFYWLELITAGFFTLLSLAINALYAFSLGKPLTGMGQLLSGFFFFLHFGFFLVMLCFMIGAFLPEGTPTRNLTSPMIPMIVVIENMPFFAMLPIVMTWRCFVFITDFILPRQYRHDEPHVMLDAYKDLGILFTSAFLGVFIGMKTGNPIWGAVILCCLKTTVTYFIARHKTTAQADVSDMPEHSQGQ